MFRKSFYLSSVFVAFAVVTCAQEWTRLGPEGGMVISLDGGSGGRVYLGVSDGHVFGSDDAAKHWELRSRVGVRTDAVVSRLLVDSRDAKTVFAAVWYREAGAGGGVFKSEDAGRHWSLLGLKAEAVRALEVAPQNPDLLAAGTRSGVFVSRDAGKNWARITPEGDQELQNVDSLAIDPVDPDVIYAGTYHLPWKTINGGKSWKPASAGLIDDSDIMSVRVDASNPQRVFISACSGIYRSENHGEQWTKLQGIPYAARRTHQIVQDLEDPGVLYAATTEGLWVTRDAGESWQRTTPGDWVINSVTVLRLATAGKERLVVGTEGQGILISDDAGTTFLSSNAGFTHQVIRQLAGDPIDPRHVAILLQRNGQELVESRDAGASWSAMSMSVEGKPKSSARNAQDVEDIQGTPWGWLTQWKDGSVWIQEEGKESWKEFKPVVKIRTPARSAKTSGTRSTLRDSSLPGRGKVVAHSASKLYFASANGLFACDVAGICKIPRAFATVTKPGVVAASPDGQVVGVIVEGKMGVSEDDGETAVWNDLPHPGMKVNSISISNASGKTVPLAASQEGLYRFGGPSLSWRLLGGGLPAGEMDLLEISGELYIATLRSGEMYVSKNHGESWDRADADAEHGRFTGFAEIAEGIALAGSQSEGVLKFEAKKKP